MPNQNIISGKWKEFKGEVQKTWGKLTDDELEQTKGDVKAIGGLLQQKYGHAQEGLAEKFSGFVEKFRGDLKESAKKDENARDKERRY